MKGVTGGLLILAGAILVSGSLVAQAIKPGFQFGALTDAPRDVSMAGGVLAVIGLVILLVHFLSGRPSRGSESGRNE